MFSCCRFFKEGDGADAACCEDVARFWRRKLVSYFRRCPNLARRCEEYLPQVCAVGDMHALVESLCEWSVFQHLYDEEYSHSLLHYWRKVASHELTALS